MKNNITTCTTSKTNRLGLRDKLDIVITIIYTSICYASFVSAFFSLLLKRHSVNPLVISLVFVSQKLLKLLINTPLAVLADLYGTKRMFVVSPLLIFCYSSLLFADSLPLTILMILLHGVDVAIHSEKSESRIYNVLKRNNMEKYFSKVLSMFFTFSDVTMFTVGYLSAILYKLGGVKYVFFGSCCSSVLALFFALLLPEQTSVSKEEAIHLPNKNAKRVAVRSYAFVRKHYILIFLGALLSMYNFFGWQFGQTLKTMFLFDGISTDVVVKFYSFTRLAMSVGAVIAFFTTGRMSIHSSLNIWLGYLVVLLVTCFSTNTVQLFGESFCVIAIPLFLYNIVFACIQFPVICALERLTPSSIRTTISSTASDMAIMLNIIGNIGIGFIAKNFNYRLSIAVIAGIFLTLSLWLKFIIKNSKKLSSLN